MADEVILVTGGGGFVGSALCLELQRLGENIVSLSRNHYLHLSNAGIQQYRADISRLEDLERVFSLHKIKAVFHTASKVDMWGKYQDFYNVNVIGTINLLRLCKKFKVNKFIYTSSPSVVSSSNDICNGDESLPYPSKYYAYYPKTKAIAEQLVLQANSNVFFTVALRPHLIWGSGDNHLIPTILNRAMAGKLAQIGDGSNLVDTTYIKDCILAHIKAYYALDTTPQCRGRAFFISQGEPVRLWEWVNLILSLNGLPPVKKQVPYKLAYSIATVAEPIFSLLNKEPPLTKFLVMQMAKSHYFNISAAKEFLGFIPQYTIEDGLEETFKKKDDKLKYTLPERKTGHDS